MRPLRNKMAKSSRHQKKQRQQQQNGSNNNKEVDSKHATTTTVTKIQNEQDQQPSSGQQDVENIEVHSIKIQRDFDKKAILPPVAVWNRLLDRSAFLISTLRVTIKRKGIFFDRELASGFYTCILNHQGYLVVYTQPLGNEGYAVNLRKASKIVFKMFNEIPIAKQRDAGQTSRLQLSKARGWYCKLSVHWHFGSMSINLPDQRMVEWCNATIFSAVDDSMLLAQVPPAGFLRSRVDAMSQIGPSLIDQKQHPQSVRTEPLMICSSNNEKQQTKSEKQSDDFKGIPLENNFLSMMDAQSVSDEPSVDNKSSVAVSDNKSSIYVMGSLDKEDSQHTLHELPEENTFEDRQIPSFLSESMQSIHESEEEIANADDKNTEEECNKQEEEVMNEEEVKVHEEDNDGGDKKEEDDSAGQASSSQPSPAQQMLFSPRRPILKRRVTFSDMKTVFKYQPTAFTEFDAPLPLPAIQKPENVDKNEKEHIVQPALDQMRIVGQHGTTISANTTATDDEEQQQQQPEPLEDSTADQRDDITDDHNTSGDGGNISKLSASSNSNAIAIQFPSFAELFDQTRLLFETGMGAEEKQEKSSSEQ